MADQRDLNKEALKNKLTKDQEQKILDELGIESLGMGNTCATYSGLEPNFIEEDITLEDPLTYSRKD